MHICFVCSGNICRSPSAALVLRAHLEEAGLADVVEVSSAGIGGWHAGEPIDTRAGDALRARGYSTAHRAAQVGREHLDADLLIAMDATHAEDLKALADDPSRVRLLRSFDTAAARLSGGPHDLDVPDPYYGGPEGFGDVLDMIEAAMPGLLAWIEEHLERA